MIDLAEKELLPLFEKDENGDINFLVVSHDSLKYQAEELKKRGYVRDEAEDFLEGIDQTVTSDSKQGTDEEIEIYPWIDGSPLTGLCERDRGIRDRLCEEYPSRRLEELCAACHITERRDGNHTRSNLNEEELGEFNGNVGPAKIVSVKLK